MRLADLALRCVRASAAVVEKLQQLLRSIDPYRYALIDFVLCKMSQLKTDEAVLPVPLSKLIGLLHFLADYERTCKPTNEEISWYAQKMKGSESGEGADAADGEPMDESTMDGLYDKPAAARAVNFASAALPTAANNRLPFHAFLLDIQVRSQALLGKEGCYCSFTNSEKSLSAGDEHRFVVVDRERGNIYRQRGVVAARSGGSESGATVAEPDADGSGDEGGPHGGYRQRDRRQDHGPALFGQESLGSHQVRRCYRQAAASWYVDDLYVLLLTR